MPTWSNDLAKALAEKAKAMEAKEPTCKKCGGTGISPDFKLTEPPHVLPCLVCNGTGMQESVPVAAKETL